jgi:hypothetical protein
MYLPKFLFRNIDGNLEGEKETRDMGREIFQKYNPGRNWAKSSKLPAPYI